MAILPISPFRAHRVRAVLPASLTLLMVAGCMVGPNYVRPDIDTPPTWVAPTPQGPDSVSAVDWWKTFDDPVLSELQQRAESLSPTLEQAVARIDMARANLSAKRSGGLPSLTGTGAHTTSEQRTDGSGQSVSLKSEGLFYGGDASWEIDLFGKVRRNVQAARAQGEARVYDLQSARVSLAAEVADLYVQHRACEQLVALYSAQAQSQTDTARLTRGNADAGVTAPADAALAEAAAASLRSTLTDQAAQCALLMKSLTSLTGLEEASVRDKLRSGAGTMPEPAALNVQSIPADLVRQRPDVASVERELAAASAEIGVAAADLYPSLTLGGSVSIGSDAEQWSYGPKLTLPVFAGGRIRAGVSSAHAGYDLQLATYREKVRTALLEVEQTLVRLDAARLRQDEAAQAAAGYRASFTATDRLQQAGLASGIEREVARRAAMDADRVVIDLRLQQLRNWIALYKVLGGGWRADTERPSSNPTSGANR